VNLLQQVAAGEKLCLNCMGLLSEIFLAWKYRVSC